MNIQQKMTDSHERVIIFLCVSITIAKLLLFINIRYKWKVNTLK